MPNRTKKAEPRMALSASPNDSKRSDLCEPGTLFRINEIDQVTHIVHMHDFTQFKFDSKDPFHLAD